MSEAEKKFEKLEYIGNNISNTNGEEWAIKYVNKRYDKKILFDLTDKNICVSTLDGESTCFSTEELQAINKKVEELGWI